MTCFIMLGRSARAFQNPEIDVRRFQIPSFSRDAAKEGGSRQSTSASARTSRPSIRCLLPEQRLGLMLHVRREEENERGGAVCVTSGGTRLDIRRISKLNI